MNIWRDRLHRWLAPIARRSPLSPNAITLIALLINMAVGALLYMRWFFAAMVVLAFSGLADAFDGIVARVQGKETRFGDFLDHFADRVSDAFILTGWLLGNEVRIEVALAATIAIGLNSYIGTQLQATWHEREYDTVGRGEFILALMIFPIFSSILYQNHWDHLTFSGLRIVEWMALLISVFAFFGVSQRIRIAARMERR
jgi:archaetidylinositol phosphate synthase